MVSTEVLRAATDTLEAKKVGCRVAALWEAVLRAVHTAVVAMGAVAKVVVMGAVDEGEGGQEAVEKEVKAMEAVGMGAAVKAGAAMEVEVMGVAMEEVVMEVDAMVAEVMEEEARARATVAVVTEAAMRVVVRVAVGMEEEAKVGVMVEVAKVGETEAGMEAVREVGMVGGA